MGPCNFPLAFNGISGGDFAAAIAAGNAVIVKGHPAHPETTRCLAEAAMIALEETGMPPATVQCFFHAEHEDIARLIEHHAIASVAFTGGKLARSCRLRCPV
jgi:NADP-dependent aldehyde dehydrogenase